MNHIKPAGRVAEWVALAVVALMVIVGPPAMFSWYADFRLNGYIIYNQFHSPTQSVMLPMAIALYVLSIRLITTEGLGWQSQLVLLVLAFTTPLTKLNFSMVLVPALALVIAWRFVQKNPVAWRAVIRLVLLVFVPTLLVLGWQFYFTYVQQTTIEYGLNQSNGIIFAPLKTALYFDPEIGIIALKLIASLLFPIWAALSYADVRRDPLIRVGWLMIVIGLAQYLLLAESGDFYMAANFNWGLRVAALFVFALSLVHAVHVEYALIVAPRVNVRLIGTVILLLAHVIGGAHLYYGYASSIVPTLP